MVQTCLLGASIFPCPQYLVFWHVSCWTLTPCEHRGFSFLPALLIMLCSGSCPPLHILRKLPHQRRQTKFLTNGYCDNVIISWQEALFIYYPNKYKVTEKQNPAEGKTWDSVFCKKGLEGKRIINPPELFSLSYLKRLGEYSWSFIMDLSSHSGEISGLS